MYINMYRYIPIYKALFERLEARDIGTEFQGSGNGVVFRRLFEEGAIWNQVARRRVLTF